MPCKVSLSALEIAHITDYLDATTPLPDHADLLFVFGTQQSTPAHLAIDLFHRLHMPYIVLTGGVNRHTGEHEAEAHHRLLIEAGIPTEKVILENRSINTLENVLLAMPLIEQKHPLVSLRLVVAICKWMHSRRALMTLKRHFPNGIRYFAHTYSPLGITRENWPQNQLAQGANVLKNWENIPKYLECGHIAEIVRDGDSYN